MKLDELYNLSRDECFELIKAECRSEAKKGLWIGVVIWLTLTAITMIWRDPELGIVPVCLFSVGSVAFVWIVVNNLRFLLKLDSLDTPEQLLLSYKKMFKNDRRACYLTVAGVLIFDPRLWIDILNYEWVWIVLRLIFQVSLIALLIYSFFNHDIFWKYKTRRDEEISDRLEDLIEMK